MKKMIQNDDRYYTFTKMDNEPAQDDVNHPSHYAGGRDYEPIDVIKDWELDFCLGNALKYISRAGRKNRDKTIEDLRKAIWYIEKEIEWINEKD